MSVRRKTGFAWIGCLAVAGQAAPTVDYMREIKPMLTQHCVRCHGESHQKGGLRVDTALELRTGGDSGPALVPGKSASSLLLQVVSDTHDEIPRMPYKKPPLAAAQLTKLKDWIDQGAGGAPSDELPGSFVHWAFVSPKRPAPPKVKRADWTRNPIDHFILARLEQEKIEPSPEADRVTLLRRLSLDLIGLPPTPEETRAFLDDRRPDAYERAVDRLLASPHHGERAARLWLDVAHYADSNGFGIDAPRQIWKYRDWVVNALNRDLPFDQFVVEQLAGDLLPKATIDQKVATGFSRNTPINQENGIDPEQYRVESVVDRVNTFGTAFLGLTIGCAQCHDHKFDPLTQRDYYGLYAFFNNTVEDGHGRAGPGGVLEFPGEMESSEQLAKSFAEAQEALADYLAEQSGAVARWRAALSPEARGKLASSVREQIDLPWERQTFAGKRLIYLAFRPGDSEFKALNASVTRLGRAQPKPVSTLVMVELPNPRETFVLSGGDFTQPAERVAPTTPAILPRLRAEAPTRVDLARWVVETENPLTARVFMNRLWQQYFGRGIVETENDFGSQGIEPTHPELLDWLATEFIAQKWSMKAMHRLITISATYRQASHARADLIGTDPDNKLLARQSRLRLDAEIIRDVGLAASGLLAPTLGGPPVFPPQPDGVMTLGQTKRSWIASNGADRHRRGLYTHLWRTTLHPAFAVFDAPDASTACTRRLRSTTPLQALTLLNEQQFYEFAVALGDRARREGGPDLRAQIDHAFRLCATRAPEAEELERLGQLHERQVAASEGDDPAKQAVAWTSIARVLLNLDEFITRD